MRKVKSIAAILRSMLADWLYSPRTIISILFLMALAYMNARSYCFSLESNQLYAYPGESIYYYISSGFGNITMTSALFLIMMAEIPRRISFQNVLLIRSDRKTWISAQVMFCCFASLLMIAILLVCSMLFSCAGLSIGTGWSDLERIAADPDAEWLPQLTSEYIRQITPGQASLVSFMVLFSFWFTMTLVILFCTLCGKPNAGLFLYVSLLVLHVTVMWENLPAWMRYMPILFSTQQYLGSTFPDCELQVIPYALCVYFLLDTVLILMMYRKTKYMDLFFEERR